MVTLLPARSPAHERKMRSLVLAMAVVLTAGALGCTWRMLPAEYRPFFSLHFRERPAELRCAFTSRPLRIPPIGLARNGACNVLSATAGTMPHRFAGTCARHVEAQRTARAQVISDSSFMFKVLQTRHYQFTSSVICVAPCSSPQFASSTISSRSRMNSSFTGSIRLAPFS